jgi:hypothetical protein
MNRQNVALALSCLAIALVFVPWVSGRSVIFATRFSGNPAEPSFADLLAEPSRFDGALIWLAGMCVVQFEHVAIHESDAQLAASWRSGIWLNLKPEEFERYESSTPRRCGVTGVFRRDHGGHLGKFFGNLEPEGDLRLYPENPDAA